MRRLLAVFYKVCGRIEITRENRVMNKFLTISIAGLCAWPVTISTGFSSLFEPYSFSAATEWPLASGATVSFEWVPKKITRLVVSGHLIGEVIYPDLITQIVVSKKRTALLILTCRERPSNARDFSGLVRVVADSSSPAHFQQLRFPERDASGDMLPLYVTEVGAISDDGRQAILRVAHQTADTAPYNVNRTWETWDLDGPTLLKRGLSLDNIKR